MLYALFREDKGSATIYPFILALSVLLFGCKSNTEQTPDLFQLQRVSANGKILSANDTIEGIPVDLSLKIEFSSPVDTQSARTGINLQKSDQGNSVPLNFTFESEGRDILVQPEQPLNWITTYQFEITDEIRSEQGASFPGSSYQFQTENGRFELESASLNGDDLLSEDLLRNISYDDIRFEFKFSDTLNSQGYQDYFNFSPSFSAGYSLSGDGQTVNISNTEPLDYYRHYSVNISQNLTADNGFEFEGFDTRFQTGLDSTRKFSQLTEEALLTKIQEQTFRYFWDFAHPSSGMARERVTSGETVATGGSGFGLQAILVGIHRGFITREEGVGRLRTIVDFLGAADRFHGAWPHWINGSTGEVIPFSTYDDGGDLVETAYMAQGLITVREFLDSNDAAENDLITDINTLLDTIEWDWYTKNGENVLYWHWSPNYGWEMNMQIKGYNEALIVYILAASSSGHSIDSEVYHQGWASSGAIRNGDSFYGYTLPVGTDYGGPLFFSHYSFLGLDPRNLTDTYADYWKQNRNHTLINREHSVVNPNDFVGYRSDSWGLTASDEPGGYSAHDPTHDNGTITPTAAISSIPYTPEKSKQAIEHFYYVLGDKLWGEYGFYDAFNPTEGWWADSYLAIDQGPIIIMIENYRSGLLWNLFMSAPEIQTALDSLGFTTSP